MLFFLALHHLILPLAEKIKKIFLKRKGSTKFGSCVSPLETSKWCDFDPQNQLQLALLISKKIITGELLGSTILIKVSVRELKSAWDIFLLMKAHRRLWILAFSEDTWTISWSTSKCCMVINVKIASLYQPEASLCENNGIIWLSPFFGNIFMSPQRLQQWCWHSEITFLSFVSIVAIQFFSFSDTWILLNQLNLLLLVRFLRPQYALLCFSFSSFQLGNAFHFETMETNRNLEFSILFVMLTNKSFLFFFFFPSMQPWYFPQSRDLS